ncbi:hypothetical protein U9M48_016468 [Paspalum notatum var. saurae]|uniref:C2 domain-containing protein n=1 Tax=Paspalum notatum var. saurae TaxID=547442 RepID=A0AAQ3T9A4_PASNO
MSSSSAGQLQLDLDLHHHDQEEEEEEAPCCVLDIYVHHARGIHNICIYADQDVYAKFSLTSSPDAALATRVAPAGGATPRFDQRLPPLRVRRGRLAVDVLKCEVWMRSCAKRLLDDQLLGFALVPLADVAAAAAHGAGGLAGDFELSSTDLFHSPAGTIRLSLALRSGGVPGGDDAPPETSIASEVVILGGPAPPQTADDYSRIEFTDLKAAQENDEMAVQYLPFLHSHAAEAVAEDCEMSVGGASPRGDKSASSEGSKNAAASTASTVSEDRAVTSSTAGATEKPPRRPDADEAATTAPSMSCRSPGTPTSSCGGSAADTEEKGDVFKSPLGDMDMEAQQSAMQRQIMEMYVKSMQQFSESLAKMQLPIELGRDDGVVVQKEGKSDDNDKVIIEQRQQQQQQVKKDGARVFYGCRAFF